TTGVLSPTAGGTVDAAAAAAALQTQAEPAHPVLVQRPAPKRRGRWVALALVFVAALAAAGFGLTRLDSATWNRMTAWLPGGAGSEDAAVADAGAGDSEAGSATRSAASREGGGIADAAGGLR